ncbi:MAG: Ribosomal protein S11 [Candidatus Adlerbacteria bacterium GW2011_GWA1_54_10]|uniref:Small ribosomal subunit protein uS11 n=2 Tax=Candidatus Adleribacteriota TaxID=1752736 RepID=A0A0G2A4Q4_9BACT|nr:MAG: Ribosomal protein S11 [Candidatus Adlerbacteria bacterium GW2011_GWA1_54_10]KKW37976.1 MAG: Ribosomal protein S11 [Candidatus Adlerbacteria bacterium GW2011_GWB1_54_7]
MGKKRIVKKTGVEGAGGTAASSSRVSKRKLESGTLYIEATYNNTKVSLADIKGQIAAWSSAGALGFSGAKKGTPFAAAKVGELMGDRATAMGVKEVAVIVKGVGAGRESSIRAFATKGIGISSIEDRTPVPHNGPRPPKPRRV